MDKRPICPLADQELADFIQSSEQETSHHRMCSQEKKCTFGLQGLCCRLCSNGPCRITKNAERGVCGATADVIAARGFLRAVAAGTASYLHLTEQAAAQLRKMAEAREPIPGMEALDRLSKCFQVKIGDYYHRAIGIADSIQKELSQPSGVEMSLWKTLATEERCERWKALGLMPGGAKSEILDALVKTGTNLNSDPTDMLLHCLRLGIITGYYGLMLTNTLNDIMFGEPVIHEAPNGFRVIDPSAVNILVTGHQINLFRTLIKEIEKKGPDMAKRAGASRISLVGCTCVGQDLRMHCAAHGGAFCGYVGNNFTSEAILLTGNIDLVLSEFNCTLPGIDRICQAQGIPQICLDGVAKTTGAVKLEGSPEAQADGILETAVTVFRRRTNRGGNPNPMETHGSPASVTGVSEYSLRQFLGGNWKQLIRLLKGGAIRGVAAVVGCSNLRTSGHDVLTVELAKKLIAQDILVLSAGCTGGGLMNHGLMNREAAELAGPNLKKVCQALNIPPVLDMGACLGIGRIETVASEIAQEMGVALPQLPFVISAPQWLEEQALADGAFALALGFTLHLGSAPFVTGSPLVVDVLTSKMRELTGGRLIVEQDSEAAMLELSEVIAEKRAMLELG